MNLTLALFVPGIGADHDHLALAADNLAVLANPLHTRSNLHGPAALGISESDSV